MFQQSLYHLYRALLGAAQEEMRWLPPAASTSAIKVDEVFSVIFWITAVFFVIIIVFATVFTVKYRKRKWLEPQESPSHHTGLELTWSIIPLLLLFVIFFLSTDAYLALTQPPEGAELTEIQVTAKKWSWQFDYPTGENSNELHVVVGEPVLLTMNSPDVIHSLYIPAFRVKQDIVPGRYTKIWFEAIEEGTYPLYCAEYCGTSHSGMITNVVVHKDKKSYQAWRDFMEELKTKPLHEIGEVLYTTRGCNACHRLDDDAAVGPSFKGLWGKTENLIDGTTVVVDENYIRESIIEPKAKMVVGYPPTMPAAALPDREILALISFIKSLQE